MHVVVQVQWWLCAGKGVYCVLILHLGPFKFANFVADVPPPHGGIPGPETEVERITITYL